MRELTVNEIEAVSGGVTQSDVFQAGATIIGAGSGILAGVGFFVGAPELLAAAAVYGIVAGGFALGGVATRYHLFSF